MIAKGLMAADVRGGSSLVELTGSLEELPNVLKEKWTKFLTQDNDYDNDKDNDNNNDNDTH